MSDAIDDDLASGVLHDRLADLAEAAGAVILPYWRTGAEVMTKADDSPVTLADRSAEALILTGLAEAWPGVQAVGEEQVEADGPPTALERRFWLIDPLDGTRGFVRGGENFTVNIALIQDGRPVAGVVSAPALDLTWATGRGGARRRPIGGAWQAISVRARPAEAEAVLSHSLSDDEATRLAARLGCARFQRLDSSLKFCRLAEGRFDAYGRESSISEWDTAAGQAVLEGAGGAVLTWDGAPVTYGRPDLKAPPFVATGG